MARNYEGVSEPRKAELWKRSGFLTAPPSLKPYTRVPQEQLRLGFWLPSLQAALGTLAESATFLKVDLGFKC